MEHLREEVARLGPWHHDIEVAPGLRTGDPALRRGTSADAGAVSVTDPAAEMALLAGDLYPDGLAGRSFLDCACNAGGYVFAARGLGAARGYGFDAREHWIRQAEFLRRHLGGEGVAFETMPLAGLPAKGLAPFDLTLFRGIFYHLPDPVAGLKIAADLTSGLIVVNTASAPRAEKALTLNVESATEIMSGVDGLAWLPSGPAVVQDILAWCGFPHSRVRYDLPTGPSWNRFEVIGAREPSSLAHYDRMRPPPPAPSRSLLSRFRRRLPRSG